MAILERAVRMLSSDSSPVPPTEAELPALEGHATDEEEAVAGAILRALLGERGPPPVAPTRRHLVAARQAWPWLPTLEHRHLAPHPYCADCGAVKYVGSLRPRRLGGLINLAAQLARVLEGQGRKVTEAQMRLIVKRLEAKGASDSFTHSRETQERLLLEAFRVYTGLDDTVLSSCLRAC